MKCLLDHGANIEGKSGKTGGSALHHAIANRHSEVVRYLIKKGANIESNDADDRKPAHYAAGYHQLDAMRELAANKADLDARDKFGCTPLHYAAQGMSGMLFYPVECLLKG